MKQEKTSSPQIGFDQIVSRGCGLDVHDKTVVATIDGDGIVRETRTFETYTCSLNELRDWLRMHSVTHVAMESTGVVRHEVARIEYGKKIHWVSA